MIINSCKRTISLKMRIIFIKQAIFLFLINSLLIAGPPFRTDDPDPIGDHCWGFYLASFITQSDNVFTGTAPHVFPGQIPFKCMLLICIPSGRESKEPLHKFCKLNYLPCFPVVNIFGFLNSFLTTLPKM